MNLTRGHHQAFWAYFSWGAFPIYWKYLSHISPLEILYHRIIWGCVFLGLLVFGFKKASVKATFIMLQKHLLSVLAMAFFIATNWYIYVYAVNSDQVLQGSLAYFITPILNIVLGSYVFHESLSRGMRFAASIAGLGVLILVLQSTSFPWIALSLAATFSFYGVLKKKTRLGGLESSFLESFVISAPALLLLMISHNQSSTSYTSLDWILLVGAGVVTAGPILLFSLSTRSVPFNHLGIMQFLAPTLQFLIGYFVYHEAISPTKAIAFGLVWIGVSIYIVSLLRVSSISPHRRRRS